MSIEFQLAGNETDVVVLRDGKQLGFLIRYLYVEVLGSRRRRWNYVHRYYWESSRKPKLIPQIDLLDLITDDENKRDTRMLPLLRWDDDPSMATLRDLERHLGIDSPPTLAQAKAIVTKAFQRKSR